jgi:hypothetical protein
VLAGNRAVRKILTKPIWWWERKSRYPIRVQFHRLPPIPVRPSARHLVVLCTPESLHDALWAAWSWYRFLHDRQFELRIVVDGSVPESETAAACKLFPGLRIFNVERDVASVLESTPALASFVRKHPLGKKLAFILAHSQENSILYADHDVLAFNAPVELLARIDAGSPCYMEEEREGNLDPVLLERCGSLGLEHFSKMNSGLLFIPKGILSSHLAGEILSNWRPPMVSWFSEQTVLSVLMRQANAISLPRERYVITTRRQFYFEEDVDYKTIAARHFTGTVRHLMYKFGMPVLLDQSRILSRVRGNA